MQHLCYTCNKCGCMYCEVILQVANADTKLQCTHNSKSFLLVINKLSCMASDRHTCRHTYIHIHMHEIDWQS